MNWIILAEERDRWRAPMNAIINLMCFVTFGEILDQLMTGQLLSKDLEPWS